MMFQKKQQKQTVGEGWFTLPDMHKVFNVSAQAFAQTVRPLIPHSAIRNEGTKAIRLHARTCIDVWAAHKSAQAAAEAMKKTDPLLAGADSPALEEYRRHRAALAKLDLQERQSQLVPLSKLWPMLERFGTSIRRAGEAIQRRFGNDASAILNEALDSAEREVAEEQARVLNPEQPGAGLPR